VSGRVFEDFVVGDVIHHPLGRTITEADNIWFTTVTMNTNQLHFNNHYCEDSMFRQALVNSTLTLAVITGLSVSDISQHAVANLGWDEIRLPAPVFVGDTLYAESRVDSLRPSTSHPTAGIVGVTTRGLKQDGTVVIAFRRTVMVARKGYEKSCFPPTATVWTKPAN
jgi:acyl dehydratase